MLLQIQDGATALTLRGGMQKMAAEGRISLHLSFSELRSMLGFCALTIMLVQVPSRPISGAMG